MKANAGQMRKAKRGKRVGEKEGNEKGKQQPGRRRPPSLPFSPLSVCPPCLSSSRCTRCSERATSLARSPTLRVSSLCVRRNALLVRASTRTEGQKQCAHFSPFVRSSFHLWAMHRDEFV